MCIMYEKKTEIRTMRGDEGMFRLARKGRVRQAPANVQKTIRLMNERIQFFQRISFL